MGSNSLLVSVNQPAKHLIEMRDELMEIRFDRIQDTFSFDTMHDENKGVC